MLWYSTKELIIWKKQFLWKYVKFMESFSLGMRSHVPITYPCITDYPKMQTLSGLRNNNPFIVISYGSWPHSARLFSLGPFVWLQSEGGWGCSLLRRIHSHLALAQVPLRRLRALTTWGLRHFLLSPCSISMWYLPPGGFRWYSYMVAQSSKVVYPPKGGRAFPLWLQKSCSVAFTSLHHNCH